MYSKKEIRILVRNLLSDNPSRSLRSRKIFQNIIRLKEYKNSSSILLFYGTEQETDTSDLIDYSLKHGKKVFLPSAEQLMITEVKKRDILIEKRHGIKEPSIAAKILPTQIDLAIIPAMAFDRSGHRIGHGKGWYDRLLPQIRTKHKVGICFQEQLLDKIPDEVHDIGVDLVITEGEVIRVK